MLPYDSFSDSQLLDLLKNSDDNAFSEIYNRYWKKMLLIAWNHMQQKDKAEDIVHEIFLSLWERKDNVEILNLSGFLATGVKFSIFKHYQQERRRSLLAKTNYAFNELVNEEEEWDALFLKHYIDGLIEELPEKCRLTFLYKRDEALSNAEIAQKMNISEKGVEANLSQARQKIKENLSKNNILFWLSIPKQTYLAIFHKNFFC